MRANRECAVGNLTDTMTLEQQIGQLLMVGFSGVTAPPEVLDVIRSGYVGNICLFSRNIHTPRQSLRLTSSLQTAARDAGQPFPLLIATDQENGIVRRTGPHTTVFLGNMALGAIGSEETVEQISRASGEELRALGILLNLAPVVDVANNPDNPVIGVRSFGADPALVASLGAATVRGLRAAGVAATLKHFPGHGDTATDSHRGLPVVPFDLDRLEALELLPFRQGIAAGAEAVMTAHVALPAITHSQVPATLSAEVLRGLLRGRLGFEGIIITDCLEMNAISKTVGVGRGAVQAVQAGADIVLVSHRADRQRAALEAIRAAVAEGEIAPETIRQAAERVLRLKQRLPLWDDLPDAAGAENVSTAAHRELADEIYDRSITLIRDEAGLIPLAREHAGRILVVSQARPNISQAADRGFEPKRFVNALRTHPAGTAADVIGRALPVKASDEDLAALRREAAQADVVILMTCNAHLDGSIAGYQAIAKALRDARRPVIGIAVCNPYDARALPAIGTWLATYDFMPPALDAAARVLAGTLTARGTLPVAL
jgi:beta-N-acetylhexosaminidase